MYFASPVNLILLVAMLSGTGCRESNPAGRIGTSGTITVNEVPLSSGMIEFLPDPESGTGGVSSGVEIKEGRFSIAAKNGPSSGKYLIRVRAFRPTGKKVNAKNDPSEPDNWVDEIEQFLPARYNTQTTLSHEFLPGEQNIIDLKLTEP